MSIKCLIIDDEPLAQRVIERYAEEVTFLDIVQKCNNSLDALELLRSHDIELIFLDINMPKLSGLEFLRTLKHPPLIIITTAYASYAVQGFELGVVDYLMKPFSFDRFLKAVQKAQDILSSRKVQQAEPHVQEKQEEQHIFIKSSKKTYRVRIEDILYIEALGDYVKIYTTERMIVSYQSLKNIENLLPPASFPRIHKSYIIALSKVDTIEGNHVKIRNQVIPIGSNFKAGFDKLIRSI
jgi:DNA-binding LytR/AlgR family response regulator